MKYLLQGMETRATVDALLAFTKITSGPKLDAIYYHLVQGCALSRAAVMYGVSQSHLSEAITKLNKVAKYAERYHELKVHFPDTNTQLVNRITLMQDDGATVADIIAIIGTRV